MSSIEDARFQLSKLKGKSKFEKMLRNIFKKRPFNLIGRLPRTQNWFNSGWELLFLTL